MIEEFTGSKTKDFEKGGRYWTADELCHQGAQQADAALQVPSDERVVKYLKDLPSTEDEEESMDDDEGKPGLSQHREDRENYKEDNIPAGKTQGIWNISVKCFHA